MDLFISCAPINIIVINVYTVMCCPKTGKSYSRMKNPETLTFITELCAFSSDEKTIQIILELIKSEKMPR